MLDIILMGFLAVFSTAAIMLLACGNKSGVIGALLTGVVGGALIAIPMLREHLWFEASFMVAFGTAGAFIGTYLPETHRIKKFMREQSKLRVSCGKYFHLGS